VRADPPDSFVADSRNIFVVFVDDEKTKSTNCSGGNQGK
jgi:hypothetical protein